MANLVSPGYKKSALISQTLNPTSERIIEFKGLNRKPVVDEGEMSDMWNLTSDNYPLLSPRKPRGTYTLPAGVKVPLQIMTRYNKIAMIAKDTSNNINFYFDQQKVATVTGLTSSSFMVAINTKICFFPQKTYLTITSNGTQITIGSFGNLEASFSNTGAGGTAVNVTITNEDAQMALNEDYGFAYDDAINITGDLSYTSGGNAHTVTANVSCLVEGLSGTTLILPRETFIELTGEGATDITFTGMITRKMPSLDYVIEWNNRLWGANRIDNTIYASKLGDPKNWQYFQGTSLDSYYAQQGTDGIWTGAAGYSNHIIFFKQNSMTKIYGSSPSTFQVANVQCYGVEEGSSKSVAVINDQIFYKSIEGIMAYDGGVPYQISQKLNKNFRNVVAGTDGKKYYASGYISGEGRELLVLDTDKAVWHKEDRTIMSDCCNLDNKLYYIETESESIKCANTVITANYLPVGSGTAKSGVVHVINPESATETYNDIDWMAVFGPFDEFIENRKIYSRLLLRLVRNADSEVSVYISINEGPWELVQKFDPTKTGGDYIPIIPRRCDRYSIKIEGRGNCSIKSLTRRVRIGTGGRL